MSASSHETRKAQKLHFRLKNFVVNLNYILAGLRIGITLMRIRIQFFTLMRIWIRLSLYFGSGSRSGSRSLYSDGNVCATTGR
jgi:hypothetical protein